ncbi:bifunctional methylenetetrahydrofolate dehydrogenase/methenyltetrahydrofolate cyclohydrolase FolD [uncultured Dubosiella sp.]|uniref:bifunctional methylenetetrahydrofolate dehydrogenase/methenyltetrahydrofolate cyclohydrolase FolD n=1 Tax=uncultured Dubosiella sp. TaxID=1937011 RepID=UPI00272D7B85|nr:bifunctional methylenetetrahydrofolate dehydrogenase/methenyltetrahydrofolate cyclohydrolase FolD [uncultured Dubosiella sp.]
MTVLYGNQLADTIKQEIRGKIDQLREDGKRIPMLAVILVGDDPASATYVRSKEKACKSVGMEAAMIEMDRTATTEDVLRAVKTCNEDADVDGILVQLPLPAHIDQNKVIAAIDPNKDVDGLTPVNAGKLLLGQKGLVPCTPKGVMAMLASIGLTDLSRKRAVVVGRSILVGKPLALLLQAKNATVTVVHSQTVDPEKICHEADIVVVAIGVPNFITKGWIKKGAVVIDVGINRVDGKLVGDVDFESVKDKVSYISPVPKGVGPMTVCMLLSNTLEAYERREKENDGDRVRSK